MLGKIYEYLDALRDGDVDLYTAPNKVAKEFRITTTMAGAIVSQWIKDNNNEG